MPLVYNLETSKDIKVIGNIPYKITGPIIFKLLEERVIIASAYLTMQAEVARRIVSKPFNRTVWICFSGLSDSY
ncbi:MAG: hypothetical protein MZV70_58015 [Desulfobacterales bacterium]|nr:hypothetical protein [Desulfobacterales bacterium]